MLSNFSIRVTINHRRSFQEKPFDPRNAFWEPIISEQRLKSNYPFDDIEQEFLTSFGGFLKSELVEYIEQQIIGFEQSILPREYPDLREFLQFPEKYIFDRFQGSPASYFNSISTIYSKISDVKSELFRQHPFYRQLVEKRAIAQQIIFTVNNISYGSFEYDISIAPIEKIATIFDSNFDLFKAFLDVYIPESFKNSIGDNDGSDLNFRIQVPETIITSFKKSSYEFPKMEAHNNTSNMYSHSTVDKGKYYWIVSNFSLLIPVILSLIVLYFVYQAIADIGRHQEEALKPVLDSQTKLIEHYQELTTNYETFQQILFKKALGDIETAKTKTK